MEKTSSGIAANLLDAMSTLVNQAVADAGFDKTVEAQIVSYEDSKAGKYKIKYQGEYFYAFSDNTEVVYSKGTTVYVLFPGNSKTAQKTIVGSVKNLGTSYVNVLSESAKYIDIGTTVITNNKEDEIFELNSFHPDEDDSSKQRDVITLYSWDSKTQTADPSGKMTLDEDKIKEYLSSADSIRLKADFKNSLPTEQQMRGNYGLKMILEFRSDTDANKPILKEYVIDTTSMTGNPYMPLDTYITQEKLFPIEADHFVRVRGLFLFAENFPNIKSGKDNDIFVSNVELYFTDALSDEELNGYYLKLSTPKGTTFNKAGSTIGLKTLEIIAQGVLKGQDITPSSKDEYYWFVENPKISPASVYYTAYGGNGWYCLNTFQATDTDDNGNPTAGTFQPKKDNKFIIEKTQVLSYKTNFKCVAIVDGTTLSKEFTIFNEDCDYKFSIFADIFSSDISTQEKKLSSSQFEVFKKQCTKLLTENYGEQSRQEIEENLIKTYTQSNVSFENNIGITNLICTCSGISEEQFSKLKFCWSCTDIFGKNTLLVPNEKLLADIKALEDELTPLKKDVDDKKPGAAAKWDSPDIKTKRDSLEEYKKEIYIKENKYFNIDANRIENATTYRCGVYDDNENLLGSASIILSNATTAAEYTLVITNGDQVFQYTESGIAPNSTSLKKPMTIAPLSFTIIDKKGNEFTEENKKTCECTWRVPKKNTMLTLPKEAEPSNVEEEYNTYDDVLNLDYGISSIYRVNHDNSNIDLHVTYRGYELNASTNFSFVKTGEPGTNGTKFVAKALKNDRYTNTQIRNDYILLKKIRTVSSQEVENNRFYPDNGKWVKAELWHNGEPIFDSSKDSQSTEGKPVDVKWSVVKNVYAPGIEDFQPLSIDNNGNVTINKDLLTGKNMNLLNTYGVTITAWEESLKNAEVATRATAAEKKKNLDDCRAKISSLEAQLSKSSLTDAEKTQLQKELTSYKEELPTLQEENIVAQRAWGKDKIEIDSFNDYKTSGIDSTPCLFLKVEMTYDGIIYSDIIPVMIVDILDAAYSDLDIELDQGGFIHAMYSSDGRRSQYDSINPFTLASSFPVVYKGENQKERFELVRQDSGEHANEYRFESTWDSIGTIAEKDKDGKWKWKNVSSLELDKSKNKALDDEISKKPSVNNANKRWFKPADTYDGYCVNTLARCIIKDKQVDNKEVAICYIPVYFLLNKFGNSAINSWDGNSIDLGEESGVILAPQMGAGKKETDNSFTGVVMGTENVGGTKYTGLLGYSHGERTIFLDADNGKAEFGKNGEGQIIIDPTDTEGGKIYGGNYKYTGKADTGSGMCINLKQPYIKFGTGNFEVDPFGAIKATSGKIGGWDIGTNKLTSNAGKVGMQSMKQGEKPEDVYAFWAGDVDPSKANFSVKYDGSAIVDNLRISSMDWQGNYVTIDDGAIYTRNKDGTEHKTFDAKTKGFYLGADGLSIGGSDATNNATGSNETGGFRVDSKGYMVATEGRFGQWFIGEKGFGTIKKSLKDRSDGIYIDPEGIVFGNPDDVQEDLPAPTRAGKYGVFQVDKDGTLYSVQGFIGGWRITDNALYQDQVGISSIYKDGDNIDRNKVAFWAGTSKSNKENAPFRINYKGQLWANDAEIRGTIHASSGEIGGWKITTSSLKANGIEINSNGAIIGSNWKINASGNSYFNDITCYGSFTGGSNGGTLNSDGYTGNGKGCWGNSRGTAALNEDGVISSNGASLGGLSVGKSVHAWGTTCSIEADGADLLLYGSGCYLSVSSHIYSPQDIQTSDHFYQTSTASKNTFPGGISTGAITCSSITAEGAKPRTIYTENYGKRLLTAYETTEYLFGDCGIGVIGEDGKCYIALDPIYAQSTDNHSNIKVFLTKYGEGDIYFDRQNSEDEIYLLIKGTPGLEFCWEWRLPQKEFGNIERMERFETIFENPTQKFQKEYQYDININEEIQKARGGFLKR